MRRGELRRTKGEFGEQFVGFVEDWRGAGGGKPGLKMVGVLV